MGHAARPAGCCRSDDRENRRLRSIRPRGLGGLRRYPRAPARHRPRSRPPAESMSKPQLPAQELVREPTDEGYLEREGVRLHWLEWAPSGTPEFPAFLLLHGLSSKARYWERVARRMTSRRR